jgi:8-oxo-dGTP pyrophosphatase MutT (NUDIX family)
MKGHQVGVFPVTEDGKIVLVTTLNGKYWIFPKGNTADGRSDRVMAREEAFEEAGLEGRLRQQCERFKTPLGKSRTLHLYPMKVEKILKRYPERRLRKRVIVSYEKAEKMLSKDLKSILRKMRKRDYI